MNRRGGIFFLAFILTIYAANLAIEIWGVVPVGFGLMAPAAVYFVGLSFVLRDYVQEYLGTKFTFYAILLGAVLSLIVSPTLALASGAAFLVSETLDLAVYTPLRRLQKTAAMLASNVVGAVADSAVFLYLAFGSFTFLAGQVVGKLWIGVGSVLLIRLLVAVLSRNAHHKSLL